MPNINTLKFTATAAVKVEFTAAPAVKVEFTAAAAVNSTFKAAAAVNFSLVIFGTKFTAVAAVQIILH